MFGTEKLKHRILELEKELKKRDSQISKMDSCLKDYIRKFEMMQNISSNTPDDCKRGEWCKACEFANVYHVPSLYMLDYELTTTPIYICGKGESCKNFVQKSKGEN